MTDAAGRYGEIFDRGYLHYEGKRLGQAHAIWALARYSMARAVGIRRSWTAKIIPMLIYAAVAIPVIIGIGIRTFFPAAQILDYPSFFGAIFLLEGIFVAMIAPEMMSTDRHDRLLPLYFSRPIGRSSYVLAKLLGTGILTLSISLLPVVVLWLGNGFLAPEPIPALRESLGDLGRICVAGIMIAFYLGAIGLTISSFTARKSVAVGLIILGFVLAESLAFAISEALQDQPELSQWAFVISPSLTSAGLVERLFGIADFAEDVPLAGALAVMIAVIGICCAIMLVRYQRRD